jgi:hypothetical protein
MESTVSSLRPWRLVRVEPFELLVAAINALFGVLIVLAATKGTTCVDKNNRTTSDRIQVKNERLRLK